MNGTGTARRSACLVLGLAFALAAAGRADFPESFKAGIRAKDFGQWPQMVGAMRQAIAQQPRATGENVRIYGNYVAPYIPHYFLGLGLFRQGDWPGAAQAFQEARVQGTVRGLYRARMEFFQEVCSRHLEGSRPTATPSLPSAPRPAPQVRPYPQGRAQQPIEVRREALDQAVRDAHDWLAKGESLVRDLKAKRKADPRSFDRDPTRVEMLEVAERRLQAASFQLDGCRREGDLEGAEHARDDAQAAWEILDEQRRGR